MIACDTSDHFATFFCLDRDISKRKYPKLHTRVQRITNDSLDRFRDSLNSADWSEVLNKADANQAYEIFLRIFKAIYDRYFPYVNVKRFKRARKPWITSELIAKIQIKNKLYQSFIKSKDPEKLTIFKAYRNSLNKEMKKGKIIYYHKLFNSVSHRTDVMWRKLNTVLNCSATQSFIESIIHNDVELTGRSLANVFNDFFYQFRRESKHGRCLFLYSSKRR